MSIQYLYKYGSINKLCEERTEKLFTTPMLWFPSPAALNDPFECRPWVTGEGSREQVLRGFARMFRRMFPEWSEDSISANAASWYLEGRHHQPGAWNVMRDELIRDIEQTVGLFCLSAVNDEILMWSHYADNHRGYCLVFEATDSTPFFGRAQQVIYSQTLPALDVFCDTPHAVAEKVLLTKYCGWSYEREWRIVEHDSGSGHHQYPIALLSGVIFGARMSNVDRTKIRAWLRLRGHEVHLYEAIQSDQHFKVEVRKIDRI